MARISLPHAAPMSYRGLTRYELHGDLKWALARPIPATVLGFV